MKTEHNDREVFTFPDLVSLEFIAIIAAIILLSIWSVSIDAPLKAIADPNWTENPAKAPWYFVGLQEVLVYFDPWIAGVVLPMMIITGLAIIPYIDPNPRGIGIYNYKDRKLVVTVFLSGYFLWFILIFIGQYLRGPNWQFYWFWEDWTVHKEADQELINIPNFIGTILFLGYFSVGTFLSKLKFKDLYQKMGLIKFIIANFFVLSMFGVIIKIFLRIAFHIKYIISTQYFSI